MKLSTASSGRKGPRNRGPRRALAVLGTVIIVGAIVIASGSGLLGGAGAKATEVEIYKSPYCGCCSQWIKHLRANGFRTSVRNVEDLELVKAANGVPQHLQSCHTALVDGYVVEGHVPADLIRRLLAERPDVAGIAVPGMPSSAPGMDQPTGERYTVMIFDKKGRTAVYARR